MNIKRHIFDFIADHHARVNHLPTQAEIRRFFANLTDDVDLHLEQLQREGLLELDGTGDGLISIPRTFPPARRINLSNPSALKGNDTDDPTVRSSIGLDLRGAGIALDGDLFAQVVRDDSMIDAGITAQDVAILKITQPERGEIVAVMEADQLVLRRYVIIAGIPHFLAENPVCPDLTVAYDKPTYGVLWCLICTQPNGRSRSAPPIKQVSYMRDGGLILEAKFLAMLKSELKKNPRSEEPNRVLSSKSQARGSTKGTAAKTKPARRNPEWPKLPSGIALNDKGSPNYRVAPQRMVCDERPDRPFGWTFVEALVQFAREAKLTGEPLAFDASTPANAKPPHRPRRSSSAGARRASSL